MGYIFCVLEKPTTNMTRYWSLGSCNCYTSNFRKKSGFREQPCAWKHQCKETKKIKESGRRNIAEFNLAWNIYWVERDLTHHQWRTKRTSNVPDVGTINVDCSIDVNFCYFSESSSLIHSQHESGLCACIFQCFIDKGIGWPLFQLMRETSFQFVSLYSEKIKNKNHHNLCIEYGIWYFKIKVYARPGVVQGMMKHGSFNTWDET